MFLFWFEILCPFEEGVGFLKQSPLNVVNHGAGFLVNPLE